MLSDGLPDTFLPSSLPFSTKDGYEIQVMCSVQVWQGVCARVISNRLCLLSCPARGIVSHRFQPIISPLKQGPAAIWRPSFMHFPELSVRCDIIVKGARLEEAVRIFIDQVCGTEQNRTGHHRLL